MNENDTTLREEYLDDRLDPQAREQFERRLESDPELARAVDAARRLRATLRSDDAELSTGFYARTTARFEARHGRRGLRLGLNWSSAGLAAAAMLAAILFVPLALRDEIPGMPETEEAATSVDSIVTEGEAANVDDDRADLAQGRLDKQKKTADREQAGGGVEEQIATLEEANAPSESLTANEAPPAVVEKTRAESVLEPEATAPARAKSTAPKAEDAPIEVERKLLVGARNRASVAERLGQERPLSRPIPNYRITAGGVELAGAVSDVELDADEKGDESTDKVATLEFRDARSAPPRLLLIGRRAGLDDCGALSLESTEQGWEISFATSGSTVASVNCAVEIPDDGREIRFMGRLLDE